MTPQVSQQVGTSQAPVTAPLGPAEGPSEAQVGTKSILSRHQVTDPVERLIHVIGKGEKSSSAIREALGLKHRHTFRKNYIEPALEDGLIELTIPDKPTSRFQKYRLSEKGMEVFLNSESRIRE